VGGEKRETCWNYTKNKNEKNRNEEGNKAQTGQNYLTILQILHVVVVLVLHGRACDAFKRVCVWEQLFPRLSLYLCPQTWDPILDLSSSFRYFTAPLSPFFAVIPATHMHTCFCFPLPPQYARVFRLLCLKWAKRVGTRLLEKRKTRAFHRYVANEAARPFWWVGGWPILYYLFN